LNLAHMTLGEYPEAVDPRHRLDLSRFFHSEFDIGKFRDVGHLVGVNRFNQAGGAIMEDFDNDGLLDIVVTSFDPTQPMPVYRNKGDATFEDRSREAGVTGQLGGLVCYQTDYDNDGHMDIFIPRGACLPIAIRRTLLRNDGAGGFSGSTGPKPAFRAGHGTTTTTAGWTSSPPATTARWLMWSRASWAGRISDNPTGFTGTSTARNSRMSPNRPV
jgi:FG-GAP-like repeat